MKNQPSVSIMAVTPSMAENWLTRNSKKNRNLRDPKVQQYAADMTANRWHLSDQAVSFNVNEELVNGQHRLEACVLAGVPFITLVMKNLPTEAMLVLDGGMKRNTDDNFRMAGLSWVKGCGATVRRVFLGHRSYAGRSWTDQEVNDFMRAHSSSVEFAHRVLPGGRFGSASIRAPMVRAHILKNKVKRLEKFAEVLTTGMMVPGDEAAVLLRNWVLELAASQNGKDRRHLYCKTEVALAAFLRDEAPKKLSVSNEELFPLTIDGEVEMPRLNFVG